MLARNETAKRLERRERNFIPTFGANYQERICQSPSESITMRSMKRLLIVALTALLSLSARVRAEGPDDKYIEIYKMIQDGDQLAATGQGDLARQRYSEAEVQLKKLQASYPNWNQKLVEFRLRTLASKLALATPATPGTNAPPTEVAPAPTTTPTQPPPHPRPTTPAPTTRLAAPVTPTVPTKPQAEVDDRDNQIRSLQEQLTRIQNDKSVLEAKLREALAAQPAAIDPRELARAEERIRALEKEKEVLRVSVQVAESKAAKVNEAGLADLKKSLADTKQKLAEQNDVIVALRQEKTVLQQQLQSGKQSEETVRLLRTENDKLKQDLAQKPATQEPAKAAPETGNELASTKAALQSSRDTIAALQVRLRTLQEERDRLEKTRRDLETRLASAPAASSSKSADSSELRKVQKERDELQKKLADADRQLAEAKSKAKQPARAQPSEDVSAMRARLETLEAKKVPFTPEELALFKAPQEPAALTAASTEKSTGKELPPKAAPLLAEAQRAIAARRFDEAEKKLNEVLTIDDKNVETLQRLGSTQLEQNRPKDAEATLRRALDQKPNDARTLLLIGITEFEQNKFDDALNFLSRSAQVDPLNPETQNYLGITLSHKGQRAAAETALRKAIQISPSYSGAHYNLAVIYATQTPPFMELARWHYQKALAYGHPQNTDFEKMLDKKQTASQK
jgi:Flp pilus assembly protein TadD